MSMRASTYLSSEVEEDADPESTDNFRQETDAGETTQIDQMEMVSLGQNKPVGGARKKETMSGEMVSLSQNKPVGGARKKETMSGGGNNTRNRNQPAEEESMGLPTDVRTDAVPVTPGVSQPNPMAYAVSQSCDQPAENHSQKSVDDDFPDAIASHVQKTVNSLLDNTEGASSGKWIASQSSVASDSSSKVDNSFSIDSKVDEEDIPDSEVPILVSFPCYDVLLLHSEEEIKKATIVKTHLETEFWLNQSTVPERISVLLYDDLSSRIGRKVSCLDEGMKHCTFIFILVTQKFCECELSRFLSEECLVQSIQDPSKKWSVVPLFTEPKRNAKYAIPSGLNCLKGVNYFSQDEFYLANMTRMVEAKLNIKKERQKNRQQAIEEWKDAKRHERKLEKLKKEQQKKQLEEKRRLEIEQVQEKLGEREDKALMVEPSHVFKSSSSGDLPFGVTGQSYPFQQTIPYFNPNSGQMYMPWPPSNMYQYAFQYGQVMGQQLCFPMGNPNPSPHQGGQYPQHFGSMLHNNSEPSMTRMHGNLYQAQTQGDFTTSGSYKMPVNSLSQGSQQETVQPNAKDSASKPTFTCQPEPIQHDDQSLKSDSLDDEGSYRAELANCTDPEGMNITSKRVIVRDGKYGSGNNDDYSAKRGTEPSTEPSDSVSYSQQQLKHASISPGANLTSQVEEDVYRFPEETLVKEHCSGPHNKSFTASSANSSVITDSGVGSNSRGTSKVTGASYIQESLGASTGVDKPMKHDTSDYTGDAPLRHTENFDTTFSELSVKSDTGPGKTVVREIHHHHHHESEGKRVIIIQNCPAVNIGDTTTISHVKHEEPSQLTQQDDFRAGESYDDDEHDYNERSNIDPSHRHVPLEAESDPHHLGPDDNDTEVKFSTNNFYGENEPLYNTDEETSLKTLSDSCPDANLRNNSTQNNKSAADHVLSYELSAIGHVECGEARNTATGVDVQQSQQGVINPLKGKSFSDIPVEGNYIYSSHESVECVVAKNSVEVAENRNSAIPGDGNVTTLNKLKSAKPGMERPSKPSEGSKYMQGQIKNMTHDPPNADTLVEENFVIVTSSSQNGEVLEEPLSCQGILLSASSGMSAVTVPHKPRVKEHPADEGSSVDPQRDISASMPKGINISRKHSRNDKKGCAIA